MMMPTELAISFLCYTAFSCKICADWDPDAGEGIWTGQRARGPQPESQALLSH